MKRLLALSVLVLSVALPRQARAQYVQQDVFSFEAVNQNMWGGSGAASLSYEAFLGVEWNESLSLGGIAGNENATIIPGGCIWFFGTHCWEPVTADTRTGLKVTATTDGKIGVNVGAEINAGRVDVTVPGTATLSAASLTNNAPGHTVTIQTGYAVDPTATMNTKFPSLELYADFVFDVKAGGEYQACFVFAGCASEAGTLFDIDEVIPLASLNRDGDGVLKVFGITVPGAVPFETSVGAVDVTVSLPNLETDAEAISTDLSSSGDVNVLDLGVDIPSLIADMILPGSSYLLGGSAYGFGYTILSASLGPRFGIGQEFAFTSTPMTTLAFSDAVQPVVNGVTLDPTLSFDVPLGSSLDFIFPDAMTLDVTPTYWLQNSLNVDTDFLSRLGFNLTVLQLTTPLGDLGPLFTKDFQTAAVPIGIDDRDFSLAFNQYTGQTFQLSTIPEPETWLLLASGLVLVGLVGWRRHLGG